METFELIKIVLSLVTFALASIGVFIMGFRTIFDSSRFNIFTTAELSTLTIKIWAIFCMIQALMILHPRTLIIGCIMLLINNIFIISVNLKVGNIEGALFEGLMMIIPIILIWLGHPYVRWSHFNTL
jgi:hypothetical protein